MIGPAEKLSDLATPALLLDEQRVARNCERMIRRARTLGVQLRPHMKTAKSAEVARLATRELSSGITVSTVAEAEYFARAGFADILYAVGITEQKMASLSTIAREHGALITLISDSEAMVERVGARAVACGAGFPVLIEIDSGGGRGGLSPGGEELLRLASRISRTDGLVLAGVLTHAGHSYGACSRLEIARIAEQERAAAVQAAERLRAAGYACPIVSVGSTPTVLCAESLEGVTEIRPGVYTLFDLDQLGLGVCELKDVAVSVLATVIGHNPRSERVLIDAGALALSKDVSAGNHLEGVGYGWVCDEGGVRLPDLYVSEVHQEHGFVAGSGPFAAWAGALPVGTRVRILPNHACMTAAPYAEYHIVRDGAAEILGRWTKVRGW